MNQHSALRAILDELRPRSRAANAAQEARRRSAIDAEAAPVLARATDPTVRAVLDLHRPVVEGSGGWPVCLGCDNADGPDAEPPQWPCHTWSLIQQQLMGDHISA